MSFYRGQLVECVLGEEWMPTDAATHFGKYDIEWVGSLEGLTKGAIYTVRTPNFRNPISRLINICVEEIYRTLDEVDRDARIESGFDVRRFRPVDPKRIEQFKRMLTTTPNEQTVTRILQEMS